MTVTKESQADWSTIKPLILGSLMENFAENLPVLTQNLSPDLGEVNLDNPLEREIRDLLDTRVRPAVAQDGGDITFHSFEKGIVYLKMQGACSGCPSSSATLKSGIENMLKYYIPEVLEVRAIEE
jgi:Fe-S cluster biogenesis protein NfuA